MKKYNPAECELTLTGSDQAQPFMIRDMAEDDRPREKAMRCGIKSLSNAELMALIFATGIKGKSVIDLCRDMLRDNENHLSRIARMNAAELTDRYRGIGPAKAISLLAALELGGRSAADAAAIENPRVTNSDQAYQRMRHRLERLDHEEFWVMMISQAGRELRQLRIGQGGLTATVVDVRSIIRAALECQATQMILFHNHPSGQLVPSEQDKSLTRKIVEAAKLFDMRVNDHLIITDCSYYSFYSNSLM